MTIEELEDKHGDIPLEPLNFDEFHYKKHTKLSVGLAIGVLEEVDNNILHQIGNSFDYFTAHNVIDNKIQELKQYLDGDNRM